MFVLETSSDKSEIASQVNEHDSVNDLSHKHGAASRERLSVIFSSRFEAKQKGWLEEEFNIL